MTVRSRRISGLDGAVPVSPRVAHVLLSQFNASALRMRAQGNDPEVYSTLLGLREAALEWAGSGPEELEVPSSDKPSEPQAGSISKPSDKVSTSRAAGQLGMTDRGVRKAIREGRLLAEMSNGRYLIDRLEIQHFKQR